MQEQQPHFCQDRQKWDTSKSESKSSLLGIPVEEADVDAGAGEALLEDVEI